MFGYCLPIKSLIGGSFARARACFTSLQFRAFAAGPLRAEDLQVRRNDLTALGDGHDVADAQPYLVGLAIASACCATSIRLPFVMSCSLIAKGPYV